MTKLILALGAFLCAAPAMAAPNLDPAAAQSGTYKLDNRHASVTGKIDHLGLSDYTFKFKSFDARYDYDARQPLRSKLQVTLDAASVDTGVAALDTELLGAKFLNVAQHPKISFVSTSIQRRSARQAVVNGNLTMLGVTGPATMLVTFNGAATQGKDQKMGFSGAMTVKRSQFGMTALQGPVGDDVRFAIEAEFIRQP